MKQPFPALVARPTCCGKTQFVKRLRESGEQVIDSAPENIMWCYGIYQPTYDEILKSLPTIKFIEGLPDNMESMLDSSIRTLVVVDDLMQELSSNQRITNLFTKSCHHCNLSVIFILQNIFYRGKELRDLSLNCHYLVLFKSPRDSSQVTHVAKQMFPGHMNFMRESFKDATDKAFGYLFGDLKAQTPRDFRLRTNIFPGETQIAYVEKGIKELYHSVLSHLSMAQRLRKHHDFLKLLAKCTPAHRKAILRLTTIVY